MIKKTSFPFGLENGGYAFFEEIWPHKIVMIVVLVCIGDLFYWCEAVVSLLQKYILSMDSLSHLDSLLFLNRNCVWG